jgi:hypothetical protein
MQLHRSKGQKAYLLVQQLVVSMYDAQRCAHRCRHISISNNQIQSDPTKYISSYLTVNNSLGHIELSNHA